MAPRRAKPPAGVTVARVYDQDIPDGYRVLVDRLWPRGLAKDRVPLGRWAKELAPSTDLRRWYGHAPERFEEFARRYRAELEGDEASSSMAEVVAEAGSQPLVLLTATRDVEHSGATVLAGALRGSRGA